MYRYLFNKSDIIPIVIQLDYAFEIKVSIKNSYGILCWIKTDYINHNLPVCYCA